MTDHDLPPWNRRPESVESDPNSVQDNNYAEADQPTTAIPVAEAVPPSPAINARTTSARSVGAHASTSAAGDRPRRPAGRAVINGVGELMVTLGVVLLLLVAYELWVTNIFSARKAEAATTVMEQKWEQGRAKEVLVTATGTPGATEATDSTASPSPEKQRTDPRKRTKNYPTAAGEGFARIYIPSFGTDFVRTIIEGTSTDDLYVGPGHYDGSAYPGQPGNFAIAGHRVSKGSPFNDLDLLSSCDALVIETQDDWFIYRVLPMQAEVATWTTVAASKPHCAGVTKQKDAYADLVGRDIVLPSRGDVVFPVPGAATPAMPKDAKRLITLTTCHPQFSDAERMIIHGVLVRSYAKAPGFRPPELAKES